MATFREYWDTWLWRDMTRRIITVNTIVWLALTLVLAIIGPNSLDAAWWIGLVAYPAQIDQVPLRLWTVVTYMFAQHDFLHLLVNMLWLLLFGPMIEHALGQRRLLSIYILGGIAGAAAFTGANLAHLGLSPYYMLGASCAVLAVIGCAAVLMPRWQLRLLIFGNVKVVWIAVAAVVLFIIMEPQAYTSIAHAAGLAAGLLYGLVRKHGGLRRIIKFNSRRDRGSSFSYMSEEQLFDSLLAKVSRSGYSSLSPRERQQLFELSQKFKR